MNQTILEVVVGSSLYGTAVPGGDADLDLMEIIVEDAETFLGFQAKDTWTFRTQPEGVRSRAGDTDKVTYGLKKYLGMVLNGNPSALVALFAPQSHLRQATHVGLQLQALAPSIVSLQAYHAFHGYMWQQKTRLFGHLAGKHGVPRPELVAKYGFDTKYAAHVVRLGVQGRELLCTGKLTLPMPPLDQAVILAIRTGKWAFQDVISQIDMELLLLERAVLASKLPPQPDREAVEKWMVRTYLDYWRNR